MAYALRYQIDIRSPKGGGWQMLYVDMTAKEADQYWIGTIPTYPLHDCRMLEVRPGKAVLGKPTKKIRVLHEVIRKPVQLIAQNPPTTKD